MHPLLSIVRAAHCRSTHHYFAIDALPLVQTDSGKRLVRQLMRHHDRYLTGAKDPDVRFRDFQNHVIHVADGYWGGAPRVAHKWYDRLQQELDRGNYSEAAYAAGVLSHYFTDPIQPLHTGQTEREAVVHRPIEWSINQSYESILKRWQDDELRIVFQLSDTSSWLGEAILHGARFAHRKYSLLVDTYRLERGVRQPTEGLTDEALVALSELFGLAITGWARVLERAAADAEARQAKPLESTSVTAAMVFATIRVPHRLWLRRVESKAERQALELLVEEYRDTGTVVEHLPAEVDVKQRVAKIHADERRYQERLAAKKLMAESSTGRIPSIPMTPATPSAAAKPANPFVVAKPPQSREDESAEPVTIPFVPRVVAANRLSDKTDIVDAPSIGPKTAARFYVIGVQTIGEFLAQDAEDLAIRLDTRWITSDTIGQWQSQTRLMCQLDELQTRDVQLLVGAGFTTPESISSESAAALSRDVSRFAMTSAGIRYRRGAESPTQDEIRGWHEAATRFCEKQSSSRKAG